LNPFKELPMAAKNKSANKDTIVDDLLFILPSLIFDNLLR
jgi:hypothetical protein